jgi:hypothetical protein
VSATAASGRTCAKRHTLRSSVPDTLELMYINRPADELPTCVNSPGSTRRMTLAIAAIAFAAACGSNSPTTLGPTPSSATLTGLKVSAASPSASTFQLAATAQFSDSTTKDVTSLAQWSSSNASLATVTATGMVTVVGTGTVDLRATYQTVSNSLTVVVLLSPRPAVTLSGTVREVKPAEHTLASVRVDIVGGLDAGKFVMSDSNGKYQFAGLSQGTISLTATMAGYLPWQGSDIALKGDMTEDAWLVPIPPNDANGVTATARCKDGTWSWSTDPAAACAADGGTAYVVCPGPLCPNSRVK